ncbi:MAG: cation transporter, partial [Pseudomonadota bacterium]
MSSDSALNIASPGACPGCAAVSGEPVDAPSTEPANITLSLPGIHCQGCISGVERALGSQRGVASARVNLTMKRAMISASPGVTAESLVAALERAGYEAHELDPSALSATQSDQAGRDLLMRMAVSGFASMNVMLLSISVWSGAEDATRDMFHWISAAIALPTIAFSAQPFFRNAWSALSVGRLNMDVPIVLAILLALATSLWETSL